MAKQFMRFVVIVFDKWMCTPEIEVTATRGKEIAVMYKNLKKRMNAKDQFIKMYWEDENNTLYEKG
jgi:hypothetical protein